MGLDSIQSFGNSYWWFVERIFPSDLEIDVPVGI